MHETTKRKSLKKIAKKTGGALAEFAIVLPVAVIFLTSGHEAWKVLQLYDELETLTASAARFASLQDPPRAAIEERTRNYIARDILPTTVLGYIPQSDFDVKIEHLKGVEWESWPFDAVSSGDTLRVRITLQINGKGTFKSHLLNRGEITMAKSYIHLNDTLVGVPPEDGG
ncbi:MAG: hypothetical protein HY587_08425 [Candidatus Omnitrophica bacterium]|nr:hypothetical protein [Candidatus Omnitrophota bacterium]